MVRGSRTYETVLCMHMCGAMIFFLSSSAVRPPGESFIVGITKTQDADPRPRDHPHVSPDYEQYCALLLLPWLLSDAGAAGKKSEER